MRQLQAFGRRFLALFRRRRLEQDLDDELAFHLAMRAADRQQTGATPEHARSTARRQFGSMTLLKEQAREAWTFPWVETCLQDLRFAIRTLRRSAGFSSVALLTIALGTGATTAVFSVVRAVLLQPLPYRESQRLVWVWSTDAGEGAAIRPDAS